MQQERIRAIELNILLLSLGELGLRLSVLIPEAAQAEHLVEDEVIGQEDQETNQLDKGSPLDLLSVGVIEVVDDEMTQELNFLAEYCGGRLLLVDSSYRILFDTYGVTQNKYCISEQIIDTFSSHPYEHMLCTAKSDTFSTKLTSFLSISRCISICANF